MAPAGFSPSILMAIVSLIVLSGCGAHGFYSGGMVKSALYFSKAAYCSADSIRGSEANLFKSQTFNLTRVFENADLGTQAYVGIDSGRIAISFRGSSNFKNWILNLAAFRVAITNKCPECTVHSGFRAAYLSLASQIVKHVEEILTENPSMGILFTGHSLGGAMATLAAVDFATRELSSGPVVHIDLYTFGTPRVGNRQFSAYAAAAFCRGKHEAYRVVHAADVVPHVAFLGAGFFHVGKEIWYNNNEDVQYRRCVDVAGVSCDSLVVSEDSTCSNRIPLPISIADHLLYLGISTTCPIRQRGKRDADEFTLPEELIQQIAADHEYTKDATIGQANDVFIGEE